MYTEKTLRNRASKIGYSINRGFVHYMSKEYPVFDREQTGYNVIDNTTGVMEWGCYNEVFDHLWSLEDVERFLREKYKELQMIF